MRKTFIIRPRSIGSEMSIECHELKDVPKYFCQNLSLALVKEEFKKDPEGNDYVEFTIGTDRTFVAFDKKILD